MPHIPVVGCIKLVLPGNGAGLGHRVIPAHSQVAVQTDVANEIAHSRSIGCCPTFGLLIEEPTVKAVVLRRRDQFIGCRVSIAGFGEKCLHPTIVPAVNQWRKKDCPKDRHPVAMGIVNHLTGWRDEIDRANSSPVNGLFQILPVGKGIDRAGASLRLVALIGIKRLDPALGRLRIGVGFEGGRHDNTAFERHRGDVERRVSICRCIPIQKLSDGP